jgi:Flagellar hook capping protein
MAGLVAPIFRDDQDNPYVGISESSQAEKEQAERKVGSQLGKEDFLLLLVTQMQYQDPLSPQENTDFVAQLAQFSALEQMSNLNQTVSNNSAYALIGQEVVIHHTSSTGDVQEIQGSVEKVTIRNGTAYVTVDGQDFLYDEVVQVIDMGYLISTYLPKVTAQKLEFVHHDPQDLKISGIDMGTKDYKATSFAVVLMDASDNAKTVGIDKKYLTYKDGVLTIDKEALAKVEAGTYIVAFVFDDANKTVDYEHVALEVKGTATGGGSDSDGDGDSTGGTDGSGGTTGDSTGSDGTSGGTTGSGSTSGGAAGSN